MKIDALDDIQLGPNEKWRVQSAAMGRHVTQATVEAAAICPEMKVLDLACGTGEPAISIAALLKGTGKVVAGDISRERLGIAERRAKEKSLTNLSFQQMDAHGLSFSDGSFDRITSRLGIMFFVNLPQAISEMLRVLKAEGRVALVAWGPMQQPYFQTTLGVLLRMMPDAALPEPGRRMFIFGEKDILANELRKGGFRNVAESHRTVAWSWPGTPEEVWQYFKDVTAPLAPLINSIPPGLRAEIDAEVISSIKSYYDGASVNFTAQINITTAQK